MTVRFQPLTGAIEAFRKDRGAYPARLDELVPEYIKEIPNTRMIGYSEYVYSLPSEDPECKKYSIMIPCSIGLLMNSDSFIYWPEETYPEYIYGGKVERIGKWAYVHE